MWLNIKRMLKKIYRIYADCRNLYRKNNTKFCGKLEVLGTKTDNCNMETVEASFLTGTYNFIIL